MNYIYVVTNTSTPCCDDHPETETELEMAFESRQDAEQYKNSRKSWGLHIEKVQFVGRANNES